MKYIFNRRKYTIKFEKAYQSAGWGSWYEVKDDYILQVLLDLQEKYNFEIISVQLREVFRQSKVIIKCKKKDKNKICMDFSIKLTNKIKKIAM